MSALDELLDWVRDELEEQEQTVRDLFRELMLSSSAWSCFIYSVMTSPWPTYDAHSEAAHNRDVDMCIDHVCRQLRFLEALAAANDIRVWINKHSPPGYEEMILWDFPGWQQWL